MYFQRSHRTQWTKVCVDIKSLLYALLEKSQLLLVGNLCSYQNPSICTSREVTALTGRKSVWLSKRLCMHFQRSHRTQWTKVCVDIKSLLYALLEKPQLLLGGNLCSYQNPSICTSREITALTGRKSVWLSKTVLHTFLGKLQPLLNWGLNDLQSCGISSNAAVFIVREPGESN